MKSKKNFWPEWMSVERLVPPPKNRRPSPAQVRLARAILFQAGGPSELAAIRLFAGEAGWKRLRAYFLADAKEEIRAEFRKEMAEEKGRGSVKKPVYQPRDAYNRALEEMRKRAKGARKR